MSEEESVAGINVRELREEKQRLEEQNQYLKTRYVTDKEYSERLQKRTAQLEEALRKAIKDLESLAGRYEVMDALKNALSSEAPEKEE